MISSSDETMDAIVDQIVRDADVFGVPNEPPSDSVRTELITYSAPSNSVSSTLQVSTDSAPVATPTTPRVAHGSVLEEAPSSISQFFRPPSRAPSTASTPLVQPRASSALSTGGNSLPRMKNLRLSAITTPIRNRSDYSGRNAGFIFSPLNTSHLDPDNSGGVDDEDEVQ